MILTKEFNEEKETHRKALIVVVDLISMKIQEIVPENHCLKKVTEIKTQNASLLSYSFNKRKLSKVTVKEKKR